MTSLTKVAVRCFTQQANPPEGFRPGNSNEPPLRHSRVLVFDTETTIDTYQNLKIGYFRIYQEGYIQHDGLFYDPSMLNEEELITLESYATKACIALYSRTEFIDTVFYPEIYRLRTLCIGFNLPFDISRIAQKAGKSRGLNRGGFTFTLSENKFNPPIIIKQLGLAHSFKLSHTKKNNKSDYFPGHFLDAQRLAEVLLQVGSISLAQCAENLGTNSRKIEGVEHGRVTEEYIEYLGTDVVTTYDVYTRLIEELGIYQILAPLTKIYSSASLGKFALKQLGIRSSFGLHSSNIDELIGHIMSAYFGGRTECRIRKTPVRVTVLDFTSMYPTVNLLMNLWPFIIADSIEVETVTEEIRELLQQIDLPYLQDPENWKGFPVLVKIRPQGDVLPVRMDYKGNGEAFNVGINHLTCDTPLWYALPDVIASCILTGKPPEILEALRFTPRGVQPSLAKSEILGIEIDPKKDNLIQILVEERQKIKQNKVGIDKRTPEYGHLESREQAMKILVNAMSYGIFIEMNPEDRKSELKVFGVDSFAVKESRFEKPGNYFNPLLAVMITSGSRLFLAMAEAWLQARGRTHAYMDTDSVFAPVDCADNLSEFFQPLNPYTINLPVLKIEEGKVDVWFYGISSKRYALFSYKDGKIEVLHYKLHGLGHLLNPYPGGEEHWHKDLWHDIISLHYGMLSIEEIIEKYGNLYALTRMTVTTSSLWKRFSMLNEGKGWGEMIKPYNFVIVGHHTKKEQGKAVKPLSPYSKNPQTVVHQPFIDYNTGREMSGSHYFKPLSILILLYVDHPEFKYEGATGFLQRKHIHAQGVIYIGKEANKIEEQPLQAQTPQIFKDKHAVMDRILSMSTKEAGDLRVGRETFRKIKNRIKQKGDIKLNTTAVKRLIGKLA